MPDGEWSTGPLPEREQFAYWADMLCRFVFPVTCSREAHASAPFRGDIRVRDFGPGRLLETTADAHRVRRRPEDLARLTLDAFAVYQQVTDAAWFSIGRHELVVRSGDVAIGAPDLLFETAPLGGFDFRIWFLPRAMLAPLLPARARPVIPVGAREGVGALVAMTAETLARQAGRVAPAAADAVLDNFCRLLGIAAGGTAEALEGGMEALRAARLERVKRYVERHLAEPGLTPERVARAAGLSLRQLHRLFEPTGTSFARHVLERRLAAARAALASPAGAGRTVTEVAFAWGFDNLVTFHRAFRRAYGCTPGEVRAAPKHHRYY